MNRELQEKSEFKRKRLLDFTGRNKLLNYKHGSKNSRSGKQNYLRIVNEIPEIIINKLESNSILELISKPKDKDYDINLVLESQVEELVDAYTDNKIQVIEEEPVFSLSCEKLRAENRLSNQEKGINILNIAIGFLEWNEAKGITGQDQKRLSPILLYPVRISREKTSSGYVFYLESSGEDIQPNITLWQKLKEEYGIKLPELVESSDGKPNVKKIFDDITSVIARRNIKEKDSDWCLQNWVTLGLFSFANIAIYNDLDFESWDQNPCETKELIRSYLLGNMSKEVESLGSLDIYQDKVESKIPVSEVPKLMADADSTQYAVIKKALEGKSFVVEGPPGTGKSQTITNIISSLMAKDKKILFAADKLAALEVVKNRLKSVNLDEFCLELHSTGTSKIKVIDSLKSRITKTQGKASSLKYEEEFDKLKRLRSILNEHVDCINTKRDFTNGSNTIHELIWQSLSYKLGALNTKEIEAYKKAEKINVDLISNVDSDLIKNTINSFCSLRAKIEDSGNDSIKDKKGIPTIESSLRDMIDSSKKISNEISDLISNSKISEFEYKFGWSFSGQSIRDDIEKLTSIKNNYPISLNVPIDIEARRGLGDILPKVIERENFDGNLLNINKLDLKNPDNISRFKDTLRQIDNFLTYLEAPETVSELLSSLSFIANLYKDIKRDINKDDRTLSDRFREEDIYYAIKLKESIDPASLNIVLDILKSANRKQILLEFNLISKMVRNNQRAEILKGKNISLSKILEIGKDSFDKALTAIKEGGFLSCIFKSEVRSAKYLWKKITNQKTKRPTFPKLAKIYEICSLYINDIEMEELLIQNKTRLEFLRNSSFNFNLDEELITRIIDFIPSDKDETFGIFDIYNLINNINFENYSYTDSLSDQIDNNSITLDGYQELPFNDSLNLSNKFLSELKTSLTLIPNVLRDYIYSIQLKKIPDSISILEEFQTIINELKVLIQKTNLLDGEDLEYNLKSKDIENLLNTIAEIDFDKYPHQVKRIFSDVGLKESISKLEQLEEICISASRIKSSIKNSDHIYNFLSLNSNYDSVVKYPEQILTELRPILSIDNIQTTVIEYLRAKDILVSQGIKKGLDELYELANKSSISPSSLHQCSLLASRIKSLGLESIISKYSGKTLDDVRKLFFNSDQKFINLSCEELSSNISKDPGQCLLPGKDSGRKSGYTEGPLLLHECNKKRNHLALLKLFKQSYNSLLNLKPCLMMSPASASQFLPKRPDIFDVLVIDEASQMKPELALGLIARCKQIIIVGDDKQLPPSNWFEKKQDSDDDDGEYEIEDDESILDLSTKVLNKNKCKLGWHYRSRHQSLISFSNHHFYDNELTIFASNSVGSKVSYVPVDDYQYQSGLNLPEIKVVIKTLKEQITKDPEKSILLATMNQKQSSELKLELEKEIKNDPKLEEFQLRHKGTLNELDVKNLENIQGDERDVVIISTVYGPDSTGKVANRFGPINSKNGWRRLNVLFTRAKHEVIVVSSLKPSQIVVGPNAKRGVKAFREYLEFSQTGVITDLLVKGGDKDFDSPFEEAVFKALKARGHSLDNQVGVGSYRIDMAVIDPVDSSKYLLAIECDGATYHSSYSARANDRLRQQVLEGLGWNVYRIWSTDWFRDPQKELEKLETHIRKLSSKEVARKIEA